MERKMPSKENIKIQALSLLKKFYGYDNFLPLQYEAIENVIEGKDSIVLMPTGGGKSICFQIPALMLNGCTIVVSPLISLMQDQVDSLLGNGIPAAAINSTQRDDINREILDQVYQGRIKILYISPERLLGEMNKWSKDLNISFIAIDEAHCISQWGHDFRPEYTQLSQLKDRFPNVPIMALTATADKITRNDIGRQLNLVNDKTYLTSFDRPNLSLNVSVANSAKQKIQEILRTIQHHKNESGIIYCMSRKSTESVALKLKNLGYRAECYHAGLNNNVRTQIQKDFLNDEIQIICATVAFGMGINKSNIRWVIHYNMPKDIESYYQEIGRAGRDNMPADTLMFYSYSDVIAINNLLKESGQYNLSIEKLKRMQQYAESNICRRRILLSYFNEIYEKDCGNCDICKNPPKRIDGTVLSQMALSAVIRCNENIGMSMLIDILRGSHKVDLISRNYHKIKTYGSGRMISFKQWNYYIIQMLQLGLLETAYDDGNSLKVTGFGKEILFGQKKIEISDYDPEKYVIKEKTKKETKITGTGSLSEELYDILKTLRLRLAKEMGLPPYIIFSDKTLSIIASAQPTTKEEFSNIYGVGELKADRYWRIFTDEIIKYKEL